MNLQANQKNIYGKCKDGWNCSSRATFIAVHVSRGKFDPPWWRRIVLRQHFALIYATVTKCWCKGETRCSRTDSCQDVVSNRRSSSKRQRKWRTGNYGHENNKRRNDFGNFCPGGPGQIDKFNNDNGNSGSSNLDQMKLPSSSSRQPLNLLLPGIRLSS